MYSKYSKWEPNHKRSVRLSSHLTSVGPPSFNWTKPPSIFMLGHVWKMWFMDCISPQSHSGDMTTPRL